MRTLPRLALSIGAAALFAGCSGAQSPIGAPGAMSGSNAVLPSRALAHHNAHASSSYEVLYSFGAAPDGEGPDANLIAVNGTFYGTTSGGGAYGDGTVYSITTAGEEHVLHSFGSGSDGNDPEAGLIDVNGTLYGTTALGGTRGRGTVFSMTMGGDENVLHSFNKRSDGVSPYASLIDVNGTLYGTTTGGGKQGGGTVFSITTSGTEQVLHSFGHGSDGDSPFASLIELNGTLYGTTLWGGTYKCLYFTCGTVFSITPAGTEHVLHSFGYGNGSDGVFPSASLTEVKGILYGTTSSGGNDYNGTVFSITTAGAEKVVYSFRGYSDGASPGGGLINVKRTLYGTTYQGGGFGASYCFAGCGTVFSVTTAGKENVLHSFGNGSDGEYPDSSLIDRKGTLYGTTPDGGTNGFGTVFAVRL
jgi:uncharacterized repeat protein (TIGR03803 family)